MSIPLEVLTLPGISTKTLATTTVGTTEDGARYFIPRYLMVGCDSETAITVGPTISVGTNASTYNNFIASEPLSSALVDIHQVVCYHMQTVVNLPPSTDIKVVVEAVATGTAQTMRVDILGYYI